MTKKEIKIFNYLKENCNNPDDIINHVELDDIESIKFEPDNNRVSMILKHPVKYTEIKSLFDVMGEQS